MTNGESISRQAASAGDAGESGCAEPVSGLLQVGRSKRTRANSYEPMFFTPEEFVVVDQVTELIIPQDEHPGARDAGVAEFIDLMAAHDPKLQFPFRRGLTWWMRARRVCSAKILCSCRRMARRRY